MKGSKIFLRKERKTGGEAGGERDADTIIPVQKRLDLGKVMKGEIISGILDLATGRGDLKLAGLSLLGALDIGRFINTERRIHHFSY